MAYEFPTNPDSLFEERTPQFLNLGLPLDQVQRLRTTITDMWGIGPGGWVYERSRLAKSSPNAGDYYRAPLAYGGVSGRRLGTPSRYPSLVATAKESS